MESTVQRHLKKNILSLVVPVHNEEATINIFYNTIEKLKPNLTADVHYHFIDDGSTDSTLSILRDLSKINDNVHYISFLVILAKKQAFMLGYSKRMVMM